MIKGLTMSCLFLVCLISFLLHVMTFLPIMCYFERSTQYRAVMEGQQFVCCGYFEKCFVALLVLSLYFHPVYTWFFWEGCKLLDDRLFCYTCNNIVFYRRTLYSNIERGLANGMKSNIEEIKRTPVVLNQSLLYGRTAEKGSWRENLLNSTCIGAVKRG